MLLAHSPELDGYARGTLNVELSVPWSPPNDVGYSMQAHQDGVDRELSGEGADKGTDFLKCGNYIHPHIAVTELNGIPITGKLYFPAGHKHPCASRPRIEIVSKEYIRTRLGIGKDEEVPVIVVLAVAEAGE